MARLRITNGPLAGQIIEIGSELVIGRANADVTIDDAEVSRRHAVLRALGDALEVEDLGSKNGTFVDGERIEGTARLVAGSRIRVGSTLFEVDGVPSATKTRVALATELPATRVAGPRTHDEPRTDDEPTLAPAPGPVVVPGEAERVVRLSETEPAEVLSEIEPAVVPSETAPAEAGIVTAPPASAPIGQFRPPARRRRRGLASRSWVPVVLSFGTVVLTAVALVVYFAAR